MEDSKIQEVRETLDKRLTKFMLSFHNKVLYEISTLLNTGLDRDTLSICLNLCENGVNPEALAELRRETVSLKPFDSVNSTTSNDRGGTSSNLKK
ncbi:927_t:CDS:2 [Funneliformis geosporum]|uniref:Mitotic-spindle organizing protein 1 n=1 Tax=Funneliformis geosporum TaxID=1117311 RepID=A0A9W4WPG3_9GLOM|nr:8456_t:CDS:2 [Funneliformis geosporum]CAI2168455.1 927_t:CDS:2 [Funneliformis geosporum]